ncbi:hypothetical protein B8A46_01105 [Dolosigranulum pigrum]|uniref:phage major capsid protein n=1 Tax=Dolosigranulum pigrum TaxID=29394 RepID=UPI000DBF65C3|nr:phage major capsid protein [Dolosigranulum pigrum]RAN60821.1 hypothetical protein B8A46_01105 [Dolosigranulum pigrum]
MKLKDKQEQVMKAASRELYEALNSSDDEQVQKEAFEKFSDALTADVKQSMSREVERFEHSRADEAVMVKRADRFQLTSQEREFFAEAVEKETIEGLDELFPTTVIETVMDDISKEHPLLSAIDTQYTKAVVKYIYRKGTERTAYWDKIPADIRQILLESFAFLDMAVSKLSGFIALPKGYFQLGPEWLAQYVLKFLREVMEATLEDAVVNGDGQLKPIGMMRKLSGSVDGVYPEKDAVTLTDFTPRSLAGVRALLAREETLDGQISLVINPETYEEKISPNLFFQNTQTGAWTQLSMPNGEKIVKSYAVPKDKAIIGNLKNYLLAVAGNLEIKKYEETLAIEDLDLSIAKLFATGVPKDANAFVVLDLSEIDGAVVPPADDEANVKRQDTINPSKTNTESEVADESSSGSEDEADDPVM